MQKDARNQHLPTGEKPLADHLQPGPDHAPIQPDPVAGAAAAHASPAVQERPTTGTDVMVVDYGEDAGAGTENVTRDEYALPFYSILQSNSPQVKPVENGGMEGARAGMILNKGTGELYDGKLGFEFIPVYRDHNYPEFKPRDTGGGFVGIRAVDDPLVLELRAKQGAFGRLINQSEGTELTETFYLYGLAVQNGQVVGRGLVAFASTQIRKYKAFVSRVMGITYPNGAGVPTRPPLWAHRYKLTTAFETNAKGDYYGWRLAFVEEPPIKSRFKISDPIYVQGREFYDLIKTGAAKADYAGGGADAASREPDDEIPM